DGEEDHDVAAAVAAARSPEGCGADAADAGLDGEMAQHARRDRSGARCARSGKRDHVRGNGDRASANGRTCPHRYQRFLSARPRARSARAAAKYALPGALTRPSTGPTSAAKATPK